jgi:4-amino-4-deoxy-L-arabinose transferase-like glycosyltransferase
MLFYENINLMNYLIFLFLLLAASFVRLWNLGGPSFFQDELALLLHQSFSFTEIIEFSSVWGFHPPLYYFYLKAWTSVFGISEWASRFSSILPSVVLCVTPYFYRRNIPFHYAYLSLMLVFSFPIIFWSQVVDPYALGLLFFLNAAFLVWKLFQNEQEKIWPLITFAALCFYTHYAAGLAIFLLIGIFWLISFFNKSILLSWKLFKIEVIFGLICLPWFLLSRSLRAMPTGKNMYFWNAANEQLEQLKEVVLFLFSGSPYLVAVFGICVFLIFLKSRKNTAWVERGLVASILLFVGLLFARSLNYNSALIPRFFIWLVPLIYLVILLSVKESVIKLTAVTLSFLILEGLSPTQMHFQSKQDIRGAMKDLSCGPRPILIVFNPLWFAPYAKHLSDCPPVHIFSGKCSDPEKLLADLPSSSASFFLWLDCSALSDYIQKLDSPPGELKSFDGAFIFYKK